MKNKFDLITIGDSTVDTIMRISTDTDGIDFNSKDNQICINNGVKIPVSSIVHNVGGNAANVAIGCSKIGLRTAIYTNVGSDDEGYQIKKTLLKNKVFDDYVLTHNGFESNYSVVLSLAADRTIFAYHQDWQYRLPRLESSTWVYLTSLSDSFMKSNIMSEILTYCEKFKAKLVYAPGTYQIKRGIEKFSRVLEKCEVLIINFEEAVKILNIEPGSADIKNMLSKLLLLGPKNVVITKGEDGSYASDGKQNFRIGIYPTKVVEKTGAGDAYSSGFISALNNNLPIEEAMAWGTINSGHVIGEKGYQIGLLNYEDLVGHRKSIKNLKAVTF